MISVTRGMWGKSRPSKVAFSSVLPPVTTIERLKGKKRVRLVESVIANDVWLICAPTDSHFRCFRATAIIPVRLVTTCKGFVCHEQ